MRRFLLVFVAGLLLVPATAAARTVYLIDECDSSTPSVRPRNIIIACGDSNFGMRRLRWQGWNGDVARATGQVYLNDCNPNCARGTFHYFESNVTASRPREHDGQYLYTRLTYTLHGITNRLELVDGIYWDETVALPGYKFCGWRDFIDGSWTMRTPEPGAYLRLYARHMTCRTARRRYSRVDYGSRPPYRPRLRGYRCKEVEDAHEYSGVRCRRRGGKAAFRYQTGA